MLEALWAVTFSSPSHRDAGTGVAVLETGRVLGGDNQYVYVGSYKTRPDGVTEAQVHVKRHTSMPGAVSLFGPIQAFDLALTGKGAADKFIMQGHMVQQPTAAIAIHFRRIAELP